MVKEEEGLGGGGLPAPAAPAPSPSLSTGAGDNPSAQCDEEGSDGTSPPLLPSFEEQGQQQEQEQGLPSPLPSPPPPPPPTTTTTSLPSPPPPSPSAAMVQRLAPLSSSPIGGSGGRPDVPPLAIAPMMEWTDRHYRYMMRFLTRRTTLYTEMVVDETLLYQRDSRSLYLGHDVRERPLVVQLGGGEPALVAEAAAMCEAYGGFSEINLNVGCPSPRVSRRCFGARLMLDPERVRRIVAEMGRQVTATPITVKCRIGADDKDSYEDLVSFTAAVRSAGVRHLIVHARKCLLKGLSPAANRNVPPLQYQLVHALCRDFPDMAITINGGITDFTQALSHLREEEEGCYYRGGLQGVMMGRAAYNTPWLFRHADTTFFGASTDPGLTRREIVEQYLDYANDILDRYGGLSLKETPMVGATPGTLVKPLHNLFSGERGGRLFRRRLSELWKCSDKSMEFTDLVTTALHDTIPTHILDAPATTTRSH